MLFSKTSSPNFAKGKRNEMVMECLVSHSDTLRCGITELGRSTFALLPPRLEPSSFLDVDTVPGYNSPAMPGELLPTPGIGRFHPLCFPGMGHTETTDGLVLYHPTNQREKQKLQEQHIRAKHQTGEKEDFFLDVDSWQSWALNPCEARKCRCSLCVWFWWQRFSLHSNSCYVATILGKFQGT